MDWPAAGRVFEQIAGWLLISVVLLDVFLTVLYARLGSGIYSRYLARGLWAGFFALTAATGKQRRRLLPLCGPLLLVFVMVMWVFLLLIGLALVAHPMLGSAILASTGPTSTSFITACYVAGDSMSTVGTSDMAPHTPGARMLYLFASFLGISLIR